MSGNAVLFLAYGAEYVAKVVNCIESSSAIREWDKILITDKATEVDEINGPFVKVVRVEFETVGHVRKTELVEIVDQLSADYQSFLYLDSDTQVVEDISLGFERARQHGIAMAPAPHYSLDHFYGFERVLDELSVARRGQLLYNAGVIFFNRSDEVRSVFRKWRELCLQYGEMNNHNDQPFLTLAMEMLDFNPYSLSISYNYRGTGEPISGLVRIWHSHTPVPGNINESPEAWPARRVRRGRVVYPSLPYVMGKKLRAMHKQRKRGRRMGI